MRNHKTDAYADGHRWIMFCVKCGAEEENIVGECNERWVERVDMNRTVSYKSGIANDGDLNAKRSQGCQATQKGS